MFRNYLATAMNNLTRNWLYAGISVLGLAVAFAAAILIAQFVRNEFSYDRWLPGYQQVYKITDNLTPPGQPSGPDNDATQAAIAGQLRAVLPRIVTARLMESLPTVRRRPSDVPVTERNFAWVDPTIFTVFPLPALAGDLSTALQQPDTVVITRAMARVITTVSGCWSADRFPARTGRGNTRKMSGSTQAKDRSVTAASPGLCLAGRMFSCRRAIAGAPGRTARSWLASTAWLLSPGLGA